MGFFDGIVEGVGDFFSGVGDVVEDVADFAIDAAPAIGSFIGGPIGGAIGSGVKMFMGQDANRQNVRNAWDMAYFNQANSRQAMEFAANQAQIDRDWQERMSNTSYSRAVADLRNSGLNPMLAYARGGASTPSGASAAGTSASGVMSSVSNPAENIYAPMSAAAQIASTMKQVDVMDSQESLNRRLGEKASMEAITEANRNYNVIADSDLKKANTEVATKMARKVAADTEVSAASASQIRS